MREIKFRAWDRIAKRWTTSGFWISNTTLKLESIPELDVTMSTGLKDKQGQEIYEGDIVKFLYYRKEHILPIKWGTDGWFKELYWAKDRLEVIGNIYENPELIE